jgi:hypothetical protein
MFESQMGSSTPGSPEKFIPHLIAPTLQSRFNKASKAWKHLLDTFDDFAKEVETRQSNSPAMLNTQWKPDQDEAKAVIEASYHATEVKVEESLNDPDVKEAKFVDSEMEVKANILFAAGGEVEEGRLGGETLTLGRYVHGIQLYTERVAGLLPKTDD